MKILRTISLIGLTLVTLVFSSATMADHSWGKYKWKTSSNLDLDLGNNVDPVDWYGHLATASYEWSKSDVLNTTIITGSTDPTSCSPEAGNVQVCNHAYGDNGWLGLAQIYTRGFTIIAGVAKLNDYYHGSPPYDSAAWRGMVMCQEIAHAFGLAHQDEIFDNENLGTCMDYTDDPDGTIKGQDTNEYPDQHDYDQLAIIYATDDGGGGGGGSSCNPNSPKCNPASAAGGHAQWGQLVSGSGGKEVYQRRLGGGHKVITFVTWTLEHADSHEH
jgi:hypothetical protein